ncbi:MAG: hypothetical protein K6T65_08820 [Peptococcaceae bacterium]|nr:hypothetical protein [Peptococcaceae bacterium]
MQDIAYYCPYCFKYCNDADIRNRICSKCDMPLSVLLEQGKLDFSENSCEKVKGVVNQ